MPEQRKGATRYLLSFLFGLAGGVLSAGLSVLLMILLTLKTANAGTDKPGIGIFFTFWIFMLPMMFLIGAALGVKCIDGLYWLGNSRKDPLSEGGNLSEDESRNESMPEQPAERNTSNSSPYSWQIQKSEGQDQNENKSLHESTPRQPEEINVNNTPSDSWLIRKYENYWAIRLYKKWRDFFTQLHSELENFGKPPKKRKRTKTGSTWPNLD